MINHTHHKLLSNNIVYHMIQLIVVKTLKKRNELMCGGPKNPLNCLVLLVVELDFVRLNNSLGTRSNRLILMYFGQLTVDWPKNQTRITNNNSPD